MIAACLVLAFAGSAHAGLTPQEIQQLGTTLTPIGAEKAGNKDGTIPPYTGGLTTPPRSYKPGSGLYPDPFADEKPLLTVDARNAVQYADKLTEGTKALLKRAGFRMDVYKTHRTAGFPKRVLDNTIKNAGKAVALPDGMTVHTETNCYPFPIPKSGMEAMWNHNLVYRVTEKEVMRSYSVNASGRVIMSAEFTVYQESPFWQPGKKKVDYYLLVRPTFSGPARRAGEAFMVLMPLNEKETPRRAYQYLPGQRRVKMAPDLAYDTPDPATSGATTYDENFIFNSAMDRFDWKIVGKNEMYVPYNNYRFVYQSKAAEIFKPQYLNPDYVRWELHRVWVIEAKLKPGKRHIYQRRIFYLDEDTWQAVASDEFDARGKLYRSGFSYMTQLYDLSHPVIDPFGHYDFISGQYNINGYVAETGGKHSVASLPASLWTPDSLAGSGVR
jgi:hypothetical protein